MHVGHTWKILLLASLFCDKGDSNECASRHVGLDNVVCVCNATYCDTTPEVEPEVPPEGTFHWYVSSKAGYRLKFTSGTIGACNTLLPLETTLNVDTAKRYQTILGFGGAFTDSAGINIRKLSNATQEKLLQSYFDKDGSRYTLGRIPIAGTDFSTRPYTYDDHQDDTTLKHFSLAPEDHLYKIPLIQRALELNPGIKFFSSAWSPPPWMKTVNSYRGFLDFLKVEYYQTYADYILKFLDEYGKYGIKIWGVSTGNEPVQGYIPVPTINELTWTPDTVATWVANNLGPTLASSSHNDTLIFVLDDQRIELPWAVQLLFRNEKAKNYTAGIAVHIYTDFFAPPGLLDATHDAYPDKMLLITEASLGSLDIINIDLGSWERGATYMLDMIQNINHWCVGWIDWNLALDVLGGPSWVASSLDAAIIVNPENDEFYKQPLYYAIKHFSRFLDKDSVRVSITDSRAVKSAAFVTPSDKVVVVLYNSQLTPTIVSLNDPRKGSICLNLPALSMNTVIYA